MVGRTHFRSMFWLFSLRMRSLLLVPQSAGQRLADISVPAGGRYGGTDQYTVYVPQLLLYSVT